MFVPRYPTGSQSGRSAGQLASRETPSHCFHGTTRATGLHPLPIPMPPIPCTLPLPSEHQLPPTTAQSHERRPSPIPGDTPSAPRNWGDLPIFACLCARLHRIALVFGLSSATPIVPCMASVRGVSELP